MAKRKAAKKAAVKARASAPKDRPVLVCTDRRGVFFGYAQDTTGDVIHLRSCRMAMYWANKAGVLSLAEVGPQTGSRISGRADTEVRLVTAVAEVTPAAVAAWEAFPNYGG